jgi:hypothetical protein
MAKLKHDSITSISIDGEQYDAGRGGVFEIPDELVEVAIGMGFAPVTGKAKDEEKVEK